MKDLHSWDTKFKPCCYSDRLVKKVLLLNENRKTQVDLLEIKKAIYYAKKYHGSQMRQSGEPYYTHPLEVAYMVADHWFTTDVLVTSILHDTLEDTELTMGMVAHIFGSAIAEKVEGLTRVKLDRKISGADIVDLLFFQGKNDLLLIKLFDRLHNMQTISAKSPEKISKIVEETFKKFIVLCAYFETMIPHMFIIEEQITKLCYQNTTCKQQLLPDLEILLEGNFQLASLDVQND